MKCTKATFEFEDGTLVVWTPKPTEGHPRGLWSVIVEIGQSFMGATAILNKPSVKLSADVIKDFIHSFPEQVPKKTSRRSFFK